jgi:NF-X1-type zinc finger protein NFXL1
MFVCINEIQENLQVRFFFFFCRVPPDCNHEARELHKCHFGDCPPCKQICNKRLPNCVHLCSSPCHSAVIVKVEGQKPTMPWEQTKPHLERKALPCPDCPVPVPVTCLGTLRKTLINI